ncbi:MAG TPA: pitrilysin family protein [Planctomycetota bacterium]|nr:pitrilysin family protein [Planctomycetota bacterium]
MKFQHTLMFAFAISTCLLVSAAEDFAEIESRITSFKLENGLTIIVYGRPGAPVVSCVTYVKAGSADEHVGITGIAHQLEHLAFKGTPHLGTRSYEAEKSVLAEIDKLYDAIQAFEQKLPAEIRDSFLSLVAQVTSTGAKAAESGPAISEGEKVEKAVATLIDTWKEKGFKLKDADREPLLKLVRDFAGKVQDAEQYVEQNAYDKLISRNGGVGLNAFTSDDRTVYHVSLPANKLELWAALESDRYLNTVPRQLEKEKQVVLEERRMRTESNAFGKLYEAFLGAAFQAHSYGVPVIGHRSDILGYTRDKVMRFYRKHYIPKNTIISIVGDIDVEATKKLLTDYFSRIPAGGEPDQPVTVEPPQDGERRVEVEFPSQPLMLIGYHVPERHHPDTPALIVLDEIATNGRASRLYSRLVKTKKAQSVGSWLGPGSRFPRLLTFSSEPVEGSTTEELEAAILSEIEKLKTEVPTSEELKRVVTRYRADVLRGLRSNIGMAQQLADYQALSGDWRELFREIREIAAVTPEQVTAVAKKYLTRQNRTVAKIISTSSPSQAAPTVDSVLGVPVK